MIAVLSLPTNKTTKKLVNLLYNTVSPNFLAGSHGIDEKVWTSLNDGELITVKWTFKTVEHLTSFSESEELKPLLNYMEFQQ